MFSQVYVNINGGYPWVAQLVTIGDSFDSFAGAKKVHSKVRLHCPRTSGHISEGGENFGRAPLPNARGDMARAMGRTRCIPRTILA